LALILVLTPIQVFAQELQLDCNKLFEESGIRGSFSEGLYDSCTAQNFDDTSNPSTIYILPILDKDGKLIGEELPIFGLFDEADAGRPFDQAIWDDDINPLDLIAKTGSGDIMYASVDESLSTKQGTGRVIVTAANEGKSDLAPSDYGGAAVRVGQCVIAAYHNNIYELGPVDDIFPRKGGETEVIKSKVIGYIEQVEDAVAKQCGASDNASFGGGTESSRPPLFTLTIVLGSLIVLGFLGWKYVLMKPKVISNRRNRK